MLSLSPWKFSLSTCSNISRVGAHTGKSHMIQKVVSMPITCATSEGRPRSSNIRQRTVNTPRNKAGKCAPKAFFATRVTLRSRDCIILIGIRESIAIEGDATGLKFVRFTTIRKSGLLPIKCVKIIGKGQIISTLKSTFCR